MQKSTTLNRDRQIAAHIFMVRPARFGYNELTAESNAFQHKDHSLNSTEIEQRAIAEFDQMVKLLRGNGIRVSVFQDEPEPHTPDCVFPNNWISTHADGKVILYPIMAPNRRLERQASIYGAVAGMHHASELIDLSHYEARELFLEGTGSMIMDRVHQKVYACLSPRTDREVLNDFARAVDCEVVVFTSRDEQGVDIYHTNVMMALSETAAVICLDSIADPQERKSIERHLRGDGFEIVEIDFAQMGQFAGNMLAVRNQSGEACLVMSQRAYQSLSPQQIHQLSLHHHLVIIPLDVIETYGGGSVRCMMAEIFF
ncbi:MAG: arginine deiminase-related protein [Bacteroidota bacterium]